MAHVPRRAALVAAGVTLLAPWSKAAAQTDAAINIGQVAALSGPSAPSFIEINRGLRAALEEANAKGGVAGRKLRLVAEDDAGDPGKAAWLAKRMIEKDRLVSFAGCGGTGSVLAMLPIIREARVPLVAPASGSEAIRAIDPLVYHTRASYLTEITKIVEHLATIRRGRCLIVTTDGAFGRSALAAFDAAAKRHALAETHKVLLGDRAEDVQRAVDEIAAWNPASILCLPLGANGVGFVKALRQATPAQCFTISLVASASSLAALGVASVGIVVSQVVPNPLSTTLPVSLACRSALAKLDKDPITHSSLEGYIGARVLIEGLRRCGKTVDPAAVARAMASLSRVALGGYEVSYSGTDHQGTQYVELSLYTGSRFVR
jgi:branched-chain amino acid transport system substrate-binding protein